MDSPGVIAHELDGGASLGTAGTIVRADRGAYRVGRASTAGICLVVAASAGAFLATGSVALAAVPLGVTAGAYAFWTLPMRRSLLAYLFVTLVVFLPGAAKDGARLASGPLWNAVLGPLWDLLFGNLNTLTGISALRFSGSELVYGCMILLIALRHVRGVRIDAAGRTPAPNILFAFGAIGLAGVLWLELWGIGRGGDFQQSLWQLRQLFWLPVLTWLFSYCMRGPWDWVPIARLITAAACLKIGAGIYFLAKDVRPRGIDAAFMTGHDDSVLYVVTLMIWAAAWIHRPGRRGTPSTLLVWGWVLLGIALNERRIAYVGLLASLAVLYVLLQGPLKRQITRVILLALPFLALYLLAARHRTTGIFRPGAQLMSVGEQTDGSSRTREIENYNLIQTLKPNKLLGSGWGHEYNEVSKANDISDYFAQYRYIGHNSILWLLSIGGVVGFTLIWMPVAVGVFLAARSYRFAQTPLERTVAVSALAVLVAYVVQAWGDMGTQSVQITLLVAAALAASGKLARDTGAWPAGVRLLTVRARHPGAQPVILP